MFFLPDIIPRTDNKKFYVQPELAMQVCLIIYLMLSSTNIFTLRKLVIFFRTISFLLVLQKFTNTCTIHRIHKWRTRGKKLVPSHESEALEDKQKLQMKTFSQLAECLARIPPKITLYELLFKYNYVGCLLLLMFSSDLLFAIKRDAYIFK